jgi:hypothetical protein
VADVSPNVRRLLSSKRPTGSVAQLDAAALRPAVDSTLRIPFVIVYLVVEAAPAQLVSDVAVTLSIASLDDGQHYRTERRSARSPLLPNLFLIRRHKL